MDKLSFGLPIGAVMQQAFIVENIEREMERWTSLLGIGPFFHLPSFPLLEPLYLGPPIAPDIDVALAFSGSMCFELILQNDRTPSPFRDHVETRGYGFHHVAVSTCNFDADLARYDARGAAVAATFVAAIGARGAYVNTLSALSGMIELIEITPAVDEFFGMVHAAAQSWDGRDPIRKLVG